MKRQRFSRWILSVYMGLSLSIAIIGFSPIPNWLAETLLLPSEIVPSDCIVLLGGGVMPEGQPTTSSLERTLFAAVLFRKGLASKMIVSTGVTQKRAPFISEARVIQQTLLDIGVPGEAILLEEKSTRTAENAREVAQFMKKQNYHSAILVTSATHMRRSLLSFRKYGIELHPAPVHSPLEKDRSFAARVRLFQVVCHEYLGMFYYRLRGWV